MAITTAYTTTHQTLLNHQRVFSVSQKKVLKNKSTHFQNKKIQNKTIQISTILQPIYNNPNKKVRNFFDVILSNSSMSETFKTSLGGCNSKLLEMSHILKSSVNVGIGILPFN